jgi:hypothetical protein
MPNWLMKIADDTYREWSTIVDDWTSEPMTRDEAIEWSIGGNLGRSREGAEDRLRFVDEHLCSCRARLGERIEVRNGRPIAFGGGRLAYHFDSYTEVAEFCHVR